MPQYYSSDMPTMAQTSDHPLAPGDSPPKTKRDGRPPLDSNLSERSLDSVTMRSIATTASMFSSDRSGSSDVPSTVGELERRRSSLQTESVVALKIDLAEAVGSSLEVMERDADKMRRGVQGGESGPTVFASVKNGVGVDDIIGHILRGFEGAHRLVESAR